MEGQTAQYTLVVVGIAGSTQYIITGNTRQGVTINELTGLLSTTLNNESDSTLTITAQFTPSDPSSSNYYVKTMPVTILKETYPEDEDIVISGETVLNDSTSKTYSAVVMNADTYTGTSHLSHNWTISGGLANYFYIASQPSNSLSCVMSCSDNSYVVESGEITLSFYNTLGTLVASQSLSLAAQSGNVAVSRLTNAPVMNAFWAAYGTNGTKEAGRLSNENYITKFEASTFVASELGDGTDSGSIFYPYRSTITHFEEIQYFVGLTSLPKGLLFMCDKVTGDLPLPNGITALNTRSLPGNTIGLKKPLNVSGSGITTVVGSSTESRGVFSGSWNFPECTSIELGYATISAGFYLYAPKLATYRTNWYDASGTGEFTACIPPTCS